MSDLGLVMDVRNLYTYFQGGNSIGSCLQAMVKGPQNYVITEWENGGLFHDLSLLQQLL